MRRMSKECKRASVKEGTEWEGEGEREGKGRGKEMQ